MQYPTLGPERYRPSKACPGYQVRLSDDMRKSVVFLGNHSGPDFDPFGTGFWVSYGGYIHLVTAKHVALAGGNPDDQFTVRLNTVYDRAIDIPLDPAEGYRWFFHSDDDVDVAVMLIEKGTFGHRLDNFDVRANPIGSFVDDVGMQIIGNGDLCYTVGLFSFLSGDWKNVPVVHSGNIALLSEGEAIPVRSLDQPGQTIMIEAHLVDQRSLAGLSGSPVYVRPVGYRPRKESGGGHVMEPAAETMLLGLWHGAWNAPPDEVLSRQFTSRNDAENAKVGIGMGIVIPAQKIREVLEMDDLEQERQEDTRRRKRDRLPQAESINRPKRQEPGDDILRTMLNTPKSGD